MEHWIIIIISLAFSALFSGLEIAFVSANRLRLTLDKQQGTLSGRLLSGFIENPAVLIATLLLGNNIALVVYGISMSAMLNPYLTAVLPAQMQSEVWLLIIQTIIATSLILLTAEFLPKVIFRINPNQTISFFALPMKLFYWLLFPIIRLFIGLSNLIIRFLFGIKVNRLQPINFTMLDLDDYLNEMDKGDLSDEEVMQGIQMFQNVIDFKEMKVRECMVPRTEIIALEDIETLNFLKETIIQTGHSKIPIYQGTIDNIVGYAHSYDLFKNPTDIRSIIRPVLIVPESMAANILMGMLLKQRRSMAIVVDEFGGTAGMLTMEDVLEEIIGDIRDEYDISERVEKQLGPNEFIFSARHDIDELNEKYQTEFPESDEYETLAGFILHHIESIPPKGKIIQIGKYQFLILQATHTRIDLVKLTILHKN